MRGKSTKKKREQNQPTVLAHQGHFLTPPPRTCSEPAKQPWRSPTRCALSNQKAGEYFQLSLPRVKPHIVTAREQFRAALLFLKTRNTSSNLGNHSSLPEAESVLMGTALHALKTHGLEKKGEAKQSRYFPSNFFTAVSPAKGLQSK